MGEMGLDEREVEELLAGRRPAGRPELAALAELTALLHASRELEPAPPMSAELIDAVHTLPEHRPEVEPPADVPAPPAVHILRAAEPAPEPPQQHPGDLGDLVTLAPPGSAPRHRKARHRVRRPVALLAAAAAVVFGVVVAGVTRIGEDRSDVESEAGPATESTDGGTSTSAETATSAATATTQPAAPSSSTETGAGDGTEVASAPGDRPGMPDEGWGNIFDWWSRRPPGDAPAGGGALPPTTPPGDQPGPPDQGGDGDGDGDDDPGWAIDNGPTGPGYTPPPGGGEPDPEPPDTVPPTTVPDTTTPSTSLPPAEESSTSLPTVPEG
jgi:hypothetical protein